MITQNEQAEVLVDAYCEDTHLDACVDEVSGVSNPTSPVAEGLDESSKISLRPILGGDILAGKWLGQQIWLILMVVVLTIFYVSNRYASQHE